MGASPPSDFRHLGRAPSISQRCSPRTALRELRRAVDHRPTRHQITRYREIHDEYNENTPFADTTVYGMVQATLLAQVLMDIGPDLNRENLLETLESRKWEGPGLVPFMASDDDHSGYTGVMVVQNNADGPPEIKQEPMITDSEGGEILPFEMERPSPEEVDLFGEITQ